LQGRTKKPASGEESETETPGETEQERAALQAQKTEPAAPLTVRGVQPMDHSTARALFGELLYIPFRTFYAKAVLLGNGSYRDTRFSMYQEGGKTYFTRPLMSRYMVELLQNNTGSGLAPHDAFLDEAYYRRFIGDLERRDVVLPSPVSENAYLRKLFPRDAVDRLDGQADGRYLAAVRHNGTPVLIQTSYHLQGENSGYPYETMLSRLRGIGRESVYKYLKLMDLLTHAIKADGTVTPVALKTKAGGDVTLSIDQQSIENLFAASVIQPEPGYWTLLAAGAYR
jgi:hypothetical protein